MFKKNLRIIIVIIIIMIGWEKTDSITSRYWEQSEA